MMPYCDVFIPEPASYDKSISREDRDWYLDWMTNKLEPALDLQKITYLTSRHPCYPLTGNMHTLTGEAASHCHRVLFCMCPALNSKTLELVLEPYATRTVFMQVSVDWNKLFKHKANRHRFVDAGEQQLENMLNTLSVQLADQLRRSRGDADDNRPTWHRSYSSKHSK